MSDSPVVAPIVSSAKRKPSQILADIESKVEQLHLLRDAHESAIRALQELHAEYETARADIEAVFAEVETLPGKFTAWLEKHL